MRYEMPDKEEEMPSTMARVPPTTEGFVRPTVSLDDGMNNDDESSDVSPEPSALVPPHPQLMGRKAGASPSLVKEHVVTAATRPGSSTPSSMNAPPKPRLLKHAKSTHHGDEMSHVCLPKVPAPLSPPPPSLFSDVDDTVELRHSNASSRRPMSEVHLLHTGDVESRKADLRLLGNTTTTDDDDVDFSSTIADGHTLSSDLSAALTRPSNLMPGLMKLKQDFTLSKQKFFLLEQENKALNRQFEIERTQWLNERKDLEFLIESQRKEMEHHFKSQHSEAVRAMETQMEESKQAKQNSDDRLSLIQKEIDKTLSIVKKQQTDLQSAQAELEQAKLCLEQKNEECRSLEEKLEDMRRLKEHEITVVRNSLMADVEYWKKEVSTSHEEFRVKLSEMAQPTTTHEERLEAQAVALDKANATISELRAEKLALRQEAVRRNRSKVDATCQTDTTSHDKHDGHDGEQGEEVATFPESCQSSPVSHVSTITEEDDADGLEEPLVDGRMPSLGESPPLHTENHHVSDDGHDDALGRRSDSSAHFQEALEELKAKHEQEMRCLVRSHQELVEGGIPSQAESPETEQEQEIANVQYYEARLQQLVRGHQDQLVLVSYVSNQPCGGTLTQFAACVQMKERLVREATQEAVRAVLFTLGVSRSSKFSTMKRPTGLVRHITNDDEISVDDRSIKDLTEAVAEETLRAVTEPMNDDVQGKDIHRHGTPGGNVAVGETQENGDTANRSRGLNLGRLRKEWHEETDSILKSIQKECNEIFDRTRTSRLRASPRTVAIPDLSVYSDVYGDHGEPKHNEPRTTESRLVSPNHDRRRREEKGCSSPVPPLSLSSGVDLDRTLDQTEALLLSLTQNN